MKTPSKDFLVVMALIGLFVIGTSIWNLKPKTNFSHSRTGYVHRELYEIAHAIKNYQLEYKEEPPIPLKEFYASLEGTNPMKYVFLLPGRHVDANSGLRCDAWYTPYQVFKGSNGWLLRSAGQNRTFDDIKNEYAGSQTDDISMLVPLVDEKDAQQAISPNDR